MAYIPEGAQWYIADIVEELTIEGDPRNIVHINTILIRASSPEEAYQKALKFGHECDQTYINTDGMKVEGRFRGLRDLNVIYEELEDGAELYFSEFTGLSPEKVERLVFPKEKLGVFSGSDSSDLPNYMPNDVDDELREQLQLFNDKDDSGELIS